MNSISSWFCTNSSKNLFVKIVHPGGHVELHDRPILAAELLSRNPKCCVTRPIVFQQPYAVLSPETTLALGQKYYVVPIGTIRKLQLKYNPAILRDDPQENDHGHQEDDDSNSACNWLFSRSNKNGGKQDNGNSGCLQSMSSRQEINKENKKRAHKSSSNGGSLSSPGRLSLASLDNWHPGLGSITEES